jgi:hypothetical protein
MEKLGMPIAALTYSEPLHPRRDIAEKYIEARERQRKLEELFQSKKNAGFLGLV